MDNSDWPISLLIISGAVLFIVFLGWDDLAYLKCIEDAPTEVCETRFGGFRESTDG